MYLWEAAPGSIAVSDLIAYADRVTQVIIEKQKELMKISMEQRLEHGPQYTIDKIYLRDSVCNKAHSCENVTEVKKRH